jgi:catalase
VLFDAVFIPGGEASVNALRADGMAVHFLNEAYKHCKAIAATGAGAELLPVVFDDTVKSKEGKSGERASDPGLVVGGDGQVAAVADTFIKAIARHRNWTREAKAQTVPA